MTTPSYPTLTKGTSLPLADISESHLEFRDTGSGRRLYRAVGTAIAVIAVWGWLWPEHWIWVSLLTVIILLIGRSCYRDVPSLLVRIDAAKRECVVASHHPKQGKQSRVIPFADIADITIEEGLVSTTDPSETTRRLAFVLNDGTRVPWTDYYERESIQHWTRLLTLATIRAGRVTETLNR